MESRWQGHKKMGPSVFLKENLPPPMHPLTFCSEGPYTIYSNFPPCELLTNPLCFLFPRFLSR